MSFGRVFAAVAVLAGLAAPIASAGVVTYRSPADLAGERVVRTIPELHAAVVQGRGAAPVLRQALEVHEPALEAGFLPGVAWEWQWDAAKMGAVPDGVMRAAGRIKIAVIDSGADLSAPDIGDKRPATWSILSHSSRVRDVLGHGTFVSSLAAGGVLMLGRSEQLLDAPSLGLRPVAPHAYERVR